MKNKNYIEYTDAQKSVYDKGASQWSESDPDHVVGSFHLHNNWNDYELLFTRIENQDQMVGVDFGCGPGRNLVKYGTRFKRLDGVDIGAINIQKARLYTEKNNLSPNLYVTDGMSMGDTLSEEYDFVMSTICLQHISVYDIRYSILTDMFRVLKSGGILTAQMGYGPTVPSIVMTVGYHENNKNTASMSRCDTRVESPDDLKNDLLKIGFTDFEYTIRPVGPGDGHPNWIFFSAKKP